MSDQLYLSYKLRGYTLTNMLRHFEKMLRLFPYSKLWQSGSQLRVNAISWREPPLLEAEFPHPPDIEKVLAAAKEFPLEDCAVQLESYWDVWQFDGDWKVEPARVVLICFGSQFEDEVDDNLRIEFGIDSLFLPNPDLPNNAFMAQSNIRSLLHLVHEMDDALAVETRRLWTESGENFAERLQATLQSMPA